MLSRHISLLISQHHNASSPHPPVKPEFTHPADLRQLKQRLQPLPFLSNFLNCDGTNAAKGVTKHRMTWLDSGITKSEAPSEQPARDFVWVDLKDPNISEREELISWLPIHALTREKISTIPDIDRLEYYPSHGYLYLLLTSPNLAEEENSSAKIVFIMFENVLLTLRVGDFAGEEDLYAGVMGCMSVASEKGGLQLSSLFSTVVVNTIKGVQGLTPAIILSTEYLNELVMQISPSREDHVDLMKRIRVTRGRVARLHRCLLLKERILKQLLLPVRLEPLACHTEAAMEGYQTALTLLQAAIEKLHRTRDTVNVTSLNLVSGVAARLVSRCNVLDYINNVQTEMSLVLFPTALIPSVWTCNIMVPWRSGETLTPFFWIVGVTTFILVVGLVYPLYKYYTYKPPSALVPSMD
ncbi:unnamed protein product [Phytomonas sp. EM1]|nr:unnamed protein product [Phytomonas sp. EM1]|eukprot:CCW62302.1 unnamed protein product [Phytomonas sp. isolate EM1]